MKEPGFIEPIDPFPAAIRRLSAWSRRLAVFLWAAGVGIANAHDAAGAHANHHHAAPETTRSVVNYTVPDLTLVRDDGKSMALSAALDDGRPVVLAFIYTTCTTVCPLTSQTLSELQTKLGAARERVQIASISIDPEQDTPARLRAYAAKFGAGAELASLHRHGGREPRGAAGLRRLSRQQDGSRTGHSGADGARCSLGAHRRLCDCRPGAGRVAGAAGGAPAGRHSQAERGSLHVLFLIRASAARLVRRRSSW